MPIGYGVNRGKDTRGETDLSIAALPQKSPVEGIFAFAQISRTPLTGDGMFLQSLRKIHHAILNWHPY
jgi:hypothetical protein